MGHWAGHRLCMMTGRSTNSKKGWMGSACSIVTYKDVKYHGVSPNHKILPKNQLSIVQPSSNLSQLRFYLKYSSLGKYGNTKCFWLWVAYIVFLNATAITIKCNRNYSVVLFVCLFSIQIIQLNNFNKTKNIHKNGNEHDNSWLWKQS